ncbi:hypothetical protein EDD11_010012 [Mortierella claussenii]|nr:hypothetical protein EDD11_010012 [Mortierella claussenii]
MDFTCRFCLQPRAGTFKSKKSLQAHIAAIHDGGERLGPLRCTVLGCTSEYLSRKRYQEHVNSHAKNGKTTSSVAGGPGEAEGSSGGNDCSEEVDCYKCSTCNMVLQSVEQFNSHLDTHEQVTLEDSIHDASSVGESKAALMGIKDELTEVTKNGDVAELVLQWLVPSICTHESGETSFAMLTRSSAKRQLEDPIMDVRPVKQNTRGTEREPAGLKATLSTHRFGHLVDLDVYEPIEPSLFLADYSEKKEEISKTFAGALLQSDSSVTLILKAEVYERSPTEDAHGIDLAKPTWDVKTVEVLLHDNARKLLIGTLTFNILVTAALDLTTGAVSVGASSILHVSTKARLWCRKDKNLNLLVERQLRSKFDDPNPSRIRPPFFIYSPRGNATRYLFSTCSTITNLRASQQQRR